MNYLPREDEWVIGLIEYMGDVESIRPHWEQVKYKDGGWYDWCGGLIDFEDMWMILDWQPLPRRSEVK